MKSYGNQQRKLADLLSPFGISLEKGDHWKVRDRHGNYLQSLPGSPSCPYFAENTVRDLVRRGMLPREALRWRIR